MSDRSDGVARMIEHVAAWGFKIRENDDSRIHDLLKATSPVWGPGVDLVGSRLVRALVDQCIRVGLHLKPEMRLPIDPRKGQIVAYFNSLDPKKKRTLVRKLMYDCAMKSLRRYRDSVKDRNGSDFSYLSAIALSIGGRCNLDCPSCVMKRFQSPACADIEKLDYIFEQAENLGGAYISVMGAGEPLLDLAYGKELLRCMGRHPGIDFLLYTNGTTATEDLISHAGDLNNLLVFVSVDGLKETHERRRGKGAFEAVIGLFRLLTKYGVPRAFSAVVDFDNYRDLTSREFVEKMAQVGALFGSYNQSCTILHSGRKDFTQESGERNEYLSRLQHLSKTSPVYLVDLLTLEEKRYGCRAKKGTSCFIDAVSGKVAPCVLFPFASDDSNIYDNRSNSRLREILKGEFFGRYRGDRGKRCLCIRDLRGELQGFIENPVLGRKDRAEVTNLLEVIE
ncbi:MAG: radical SAM protein [Candidatus Eisenbacteria bacterium]